MLGETSTMAASTVADANLAFGFSWWNRPQVRDMADGPLAFVKDPAALGAAVDAGGTVLTWASRTPEGLVARAEVAGGGVLRIEDGFVRSPGLGAHFSPAYSLIFDATGIYYDATRPSDLEAIYSNHAFDDALRTRAADVRGRLVAAAISKYAVGLGVLPESPLGLGRVLVIGQVEDDASIRFGGADVRTNLALLERARAAHPNAFIAYKPHPDVIRAGRPGRIADEDALRFADAIWPDVTIAAALDWAEALHTISSAAGFEALLRGKAVHTHGWPFYAGWGLTEDHAGRQARRTRRLDIDSLVAGALILYPRYLDPYTRARIEAEDLLARFEAGWTDPLVGRPLWHRGARQLKRWLGPLRG